MIIREIDRLLEQTDSLKLIAQAYSEIANLKLQKIRQAVERNRLFFDEISKIYSLVRAYALKKKIALEKPKKTLSLLLTSNYRFYGNINLALINFFLGSTRGLNTDRLLIGKGAIDYFKTTKILPNYQEMLMKTDLPESYELEKLVKTISQYSQVLVFYSKLKTLLSQQPTFVDITSLSIPQSKDFTHFIFEPELPRLLSFFDSSILTLLLEQTFLESEVSRTASRFISMDQAQMEANKFIKDYLAVKNSTLRALLDTKVLENFATLMSARRKL